MNKDLIIAEEKNKGGRPPVELTDEEKEKIVHMASICTTQQIADYFGISKETFRQMRIRDEEVSSLYKKGRVAGHLLVASKLMDKIQNGDVTAIIFYLKTQSKWSNDKEEEDIKDNKLEITVKIKEHENLDKLTPYEIQQLKDRGSL